MGCCLGKESVSTYDDEVKVQALSVLSGIELQQQDDTSIESTETSLTIGEVHVRTILSAIGESPTIGGSPRTIKTQLFNVNAAEVFDPYYDFNFTPSLSVPCVRGDEPYERPIGWYRIGLNVKNKYQDNAWLGKNGLRRTSTPGEWPVCYHGTDCKGAEGIIQSNYRVGSGNDYGRGIYSTPNLKTAEKGYAREFTSQNNGKTYKVIMQNRINPKQRKVIENVTQHKFVYWLIPVKEGLTDEEEKAIVENSIRPYGILIKEIKKAVQ